MTESAADGDHLAVRLIIVSEVVLLRFSIDHIEKELLKLFITRAGTHWSHDVELQIAAQTRTQLSVTGKAKFVAVFAEMQVSHRSDKPDPLFATGDLIVSGWAVCSKFCFRDQTAINRFD